MSKGKKGTIFGGILLIILGILLLFQNIYGGFSISRIILKFWPLILIYIGIKKIYLYFDRDSKNFEKRSFSAIFVYLFLGSVFLANNLGMFSLDVKIVKLYWPIIFIVVGLGKIVDHFIGRQVRIKGSEVIFLIFIILVGLSSSLVFKIERWVNGRWGNVNIAVERVINKGEIGGKLVERLKFENKIKVDGINKIFLDVNDSNISFVKGESEGYIKVVETVKSFEGKGRKLLKRDFSNKIFKEGSVLKIKTPMISGYRGFRIYERILLPRVIKNVVVNSHGGDIEARGLDADILVENSIGDIDFIDIRGNVKLNNFSGNVFLKRIGGNVDTEIKNGNLTLLNLSGDLNLKESFSNIEVKNVNGISRINLNYGNFSGNTFKNSTFLKSHSCKVNIKKVEGNIDMQFKFGEVNIYDVKGNVSFVGKSDSLEMDKVNGKITGKSEFLKIRIFNVMKDIEITGKNSDFFVKNVSGTTFVENKFGSFQGVDCGRNVVIKNFGGDLKYGINKNLKSVSLFAKNGNIYLSVDKGLKLNYKFSASFGKIFVPRDFSNKVLKKGANSYFTIFNKNISKNVVCNSTYGNIYFNR